MSRAVLNRPDLRADGRLWPSTLASANRAGVQDAETCIKNVGQVRADTSSGTGQQLITRANLIALWCSTSNSLVIPSVCASATTPPTFFRLRPTTNFGSLLCSPSIPARSSQLIASTPTKLRETLHTQCWSDSTEARGSFPSPRLQSRPDPHSQIPSRAGMSAAIEEYKTPAPTLWVFNAKAEASAFWSSRVDAASND